MISQTVRCYNAYASMKESTTPAGKQLGAYEIIEHVASGGMGEVYRARDPRFRRDVAIKMLPSDFAKDSDRLQRFEQEVQAVGMLNHPNILSVYDTGIANGSPYLVSEYLEGETLRQKLAAGALSQRKAVDYALQLARGLAAAHEKGMVHRDLKPENVMITKDGRLKILDFGLAKLNPQTLEGPLTQLPTSPGTQPGLVLGTVGYMSPEQVRGKVADHRSDIFAFGAILYEMITGSRAFRGETSADTLSAILQKDPPEISETNRNVAPALSRLVQHCLEKDPEQRFHSAGDIAFNLESLSGFSEHSAVTAVAAERVKRPFSVWKFLTFAAFLIAAVLAFLYYRALTHPQPMMNVSLETPTGYVFGPDQGGELSISPDGKYVSFCALSVSNRKWYLWLRPLNQSSAQLLKGTEGATSPFWSPDSQYITFFSGDGKLKKIKSNGGSIQTICDAPAGRGGSWNKEGTIIFSPQPYGPLYKVRATGGASSPLTKTKSKRDSHRWPYFLPDGKHFLFTGQEPDGVYVASLDAPEPKQLNSESSNAIFINGSLLFVRDGNLIAQPFDAEKLAFTGEGVPILEDRIEHDLNRLIGFFSVSENNMLIYRPRFIRISQATWFDRSGKMIGTVGQPASFTGPVVFSPDGHQMAFAQADPDTGKSDIWTYELITDRLSRLTVQFDPNGTGLWAADQSRIIFSKLNKLYQKQISAASSENVLLESNQFVIATSCSPDGRFVLLNYQNPRGDWDVWVLPLSGEKKPYKFIETRFNDAAAQFSPDGKWVSFWSDATGQQQVYITSFPKADQQFQISTEGGAGSRWRKDGRELIYSNQKKVMSVEFNNGSFSNPRVLFELPVESLNQALNMHPDGQRFLIFVPTAEQNPDNIHLVLNWNQIPKK
jgi:eukaryotic-like serine/threonine-protein kinase